MIQVLINSIDRTSIIVLDTLVVRQNLTSQVDTANFSVRKYGARTFIPEFDDAIEIYDGSDKIFGGKILSVQEAAESGPDGLMYSVSCVDHTYELDTLLVSRMYENETVEDIIDDMVTAYAPSFTIGGVSSTFLVEKIVFNQIPISQCLRRLADMLQYDWYVDPDKDIHFFDKELNAAPYNLTDMNGNYVVRSLVRTLDGSQVVNRVKVRGGEYNGATYTDIITVTGNDTKSFKLPYRFANLQIELNTGSGYVTQDVGIDFINDFTTDDVLYNFEEQTIRFENPLADGNLIRFSGNPKIRVFAIAEDPVSIATYGRKIEKLIRDNSIQSNMVARRRAAAELYAYSNEIIDARFYTRTPGLRAGMLINVQSDMRGTDDKLVIKSVTFKGIDPSTFGYQVECVSTKRLDLLDVLRKIIEPEPMSLDEAEVAEEIFTDTQNINITEEYEVVAAFEDEQAVNTVENYEIDPFGDDTDAIYVVGYYAPTSQFDTERMGRISISFKVT